jgi:hypothetical protein
VIAKTPIVYRILLILKLGKPMTTLIQNLHGTLGVSALACRWMVFNLIARPRYQGMPVTAQPQNSARDTPGLPGVMLGGFLYRDHMYPCG